MWYGAGEVVDRWTRGVVVGDFHLGRRWVLARITHVDLAVVAGLACRCSFAFVVCLSVCRVCSALLLDPPGPLDIAPRPPSLPLARGGGGLGGRSATGVDVGQGQKKHTVGLPSSRRYF